MRSAPRGFTYDPCHGCGKPPSDPRGRSSVCVDCRNDLDEMAARREQLSTAKVKPAPYYLPTMAHWLPYLREPTRVHGGSSTIQHTFHALAKLLTEPRSGYDGSAEFIYRHDRDKASSDKNSYRWCQPIVAIALGELFDRVRAGLDWCYTDGRDDGQRSLMSLNNGTLSMEAFERALVEKRT